MRKETDRAMRQAIAAELLAVMTADLPHESLDESQVTRLGTPHETSSTASGLLAGEQQQPNYGNQEKQERARKLFMDHGYFDEAVQDLRSAISPQQRADAARALGIVSSQRGTPHLIAAMFDDDPKVRNIAEAALSRVTGSAMPGSQPNSSESALLDLESARASAVPAFVENVTADEMALPEPNQVAPGLLEPSGDIELLSRESPAAGDDNALHLPASADVGGETLPATQETTPAVNLESSHRVNQETALETHRKPADDSNEPDELLRQEQALREAAKKVERQLADAVLARTELEKEVAVSIERETSFRAEAATRRREEEELRRRAAEEAQARRANEYEALRAEMLTRAQAESEAHRLADEEAQARLESINLLKSAEDLVWRRIGIENDRRDAAAATRLAEVKRSRDEAESRHNAELERLRKEEAALRAATEEAATRRADVGKAHDDTKAELERLTKERVQLAAAEAVRHAEATRLRQEAKSRHEGEVNRLRSEEEALRAAADQVARQRAEVAAAQQRAQGETEKLTKERAQLEAAEAARRAESERIREAQERNRADHAQLSHELEGLRLVGAEVTTRRTEVEASRKKAEEDAARLQESQARIRAEEEANARIEAERLQLEADLREQVKTQQRLLEEARRRAQDEQRRLEDEVRSQAEHEEKLRTELALLRRNAEIAAQQRVEEEKHVRNQVDSLRIADAEARKRIEEAEARRRKSEDVYRLVAEKVQRVEAEAHMRALEEQKILAKLESVRRTAAIDAQARAEQEKRIKDEIEQFRRLEEVERPRLEVAALQRTQAQGLFQQQKERLQSDETNQPELSGPQDASEVNQQVTTDEDSVDRHMVETPTGSQYAEEHREPALWSDESSGAPAIEVDQPTTGASATIQTYLTSVDPYKRAAAVAELARSESPDAFELITKSFDDPSQNVRNAAARALRDREPGRSVDLFNRALEEGSAERRRNIGTAIAASGMAVEAIDNLVGDNREVTYNALLLLFTMAKAGEVQPLVRAIEEHENVEVCRAVIKLLTLTGQTQLGDAALQRRVTGVAAARRMASGLEQSGTGRKGREG
ncbi:MAG TPA: HEAT repeat domain-containing protein [Pyrinomonadaceae bacterium]|nr:HEAT repeat domain-containing protein [Pyrinomonadaceae bacterium]